MRDRLRSYPVDSYVVYWAHRVTKKDCDSHLITFATVKSGFGAHGLGWHGGARGYHDKRESKIFPPTVGDWSQNKKEAYDRAFAVASTELAIDVDLYFTEGPVENPLRKNSDDELRRLERRFASAPDRESLQRLQAEQRRRGVTQTVDPELQWILDKAVSWGADLKNVVTPAVDTANRVVAGIYFGPNMGVFQAALDPNQPTDRARSFVDAVRAKHWFCEWAILRDHDRGGANVTLEWLDRDQDPEHEHLHVDTALSMDPTPVPVVWHLDPNGRPQAVPGSPMRTGWLRLPGDWIFDFGPRKDARKQVRVIVSSRYTEPTNYADALDLARDAAVEAGLINRRVGVARARRRAGEAQPPAGPGLHNNPPGRDMNAQELFDAVSACWRDGDLRHPQEIVGLRPQTQKPKWVWDVLVSTMESSSFPKDVERLLRKVAHTCHLDMDVPPAGGVKRNMDERSRRAERSGDPIDVVRQRLRSGKISPSDLKWAEALTWTNGPASAGGLKRFVRPELGQKLLELMKARRQASSGDGGVEEPAWDPESGLPDAETAETDLGYLSNSQVVMSECSGSRYGQWQVQTIDTPDSDEEVEDQRELLDAYIQESGAPKSWQEWGDPVGWWYVRKLAWEKDPVALSWIAFLLRFNWNNAWEILRYGHVFDDEKHPRASVRRKQLAEYVDALIGHLLGGPPL